MTSAAARRSPAPIRATLALAGVDSCPGGELGDDFRISDHLGSNAASPALAYNSDENEYLVLWSAGVAGLPFEREIYGQRLSADGSTLTQFADGFRNPNGMAVGPDGTAVDIYRDNAPIETTTEEVFLDEINSTTVHLQVKLLRVLQEREYDPLGATSSVKADVQVIGSGRTGRASNRTLRNHPPGSVRRPW